MELSTLHGKIYTRKAVAQLLGLSEKRIKQLTEDGTIKEFSYGHYKLWPTAKAYITYLQNAAGSLDYNAEKAGLTKVKREDAELSLALRRGELHRAADVEFILTNMLIAFKAKLEALPHKTLPLLINVMEGNSAPDEVLVILRKAIEEAVGELRDYAPELFSSDNADMEEAITTDDKRKHNSIVQ